MVDVIFNSNNNNKKKKVKRLSSTSNVHYYPTAYITKPCDQLFGPQPLDCSIDRQVKDKSFNSLFSDSSNANTDEFNLSAASLINNSSTILRVSEPNYNTNMTISTSSNDIVRNDISVDLGTISSNENGRFEYIPAPKWNKVQNAILEEMFKKSRYPKPSELKSFAQRLHVMDSDIEDWFRKRRGRDRKTRRKNEALKSLIDNYLDK